MVIQKNCEFIKDSNAPIVSKSFPNAVGDILTLQISGANGKYFLEGRNNSANGWVPLAGINLSDFSVCRNGFTTAGIYEVGIVGIRELRVKVDAVEGEKVSIFGQIISTEET